MENLWHGFKMDEFTFEDHTARLVYPQGNSNGRLALKTIYWDAFPEAIEIDLLKNGFHLCFVQYDHRWGNREDLDRMARFVRYIAGEHGLSERIVPVGMSCGGLNAIMLASRYPELISCLYLDAPVINFLSCPACLGDATRENPQKIVDELFRAIGLESMSQLITYRDMPQDQIPVLLQHKIPAVLVCGLSDHIVPYHENGMILQQAYEAAGVDFAYYLKPGCDHHPHGLEDNSEVLKFILEH